MRLKAYATGGYGIKGLSQSGGTLSLPLMLPADPTQPMEAVTKEYVDNKSMVIDTDNIISGVFPASRYPSFTGSELTSSGNGVFTLTNTGVAAGVYTKVTVDAKGRITGGGSLSLSDIPNLSFNSITTNKPTTLAGYGISDGVSLNGNVTMTGSLNITSTPSLNNHVVNKAYVDNAVSNISSAAYNLGDIVVKATSDTPAGFLKCNGGIVDKSLYPELYSIVGDKYHSYLIGGGTPWYYFDYNIENKIPLPKQILNQAYNKNFTLNSQNYQPWCSFVYNDNLYLFASQANSSLYNIHKCSITDFISGFESVPNSGTYNLIGEIIGTTTYAVYNCLVYNDYLYFYSGDGNVYKTNLATDPDLNNLTVAFNIPSLIALHSLSGYSFSNGVSMFRVYKNYLFLSFNYSANPWAFNRITSFKFTETGDNVITSTIYYNSDITGRVLDIYKDHVIATQVSTSSYMKITWQKIGANGLRSNSNNRDIYIGSGVTINVAFARNYGTYLLITISSSHEVIIDIDDDSNLTSTVSLNQYDQYHQYTLDLFIKNNRLFRFRAGSTPIKVIEYNCPFIPEYDLVHMSNNDPDPTKFTLPNLYDNNNPDIYSYIKY